jgi:hypothetical protein
MRRGLRRVVTARWSASRFRQAKNDGCEIRSCRQNSAIDRPDRRQRPMRSCHLVANVALAARPIAWPSADGKNKNFFPAAYPTRQAWTDGALTAELRDENGGSPPTPEQLAPLLPDVWAKAHPEAIRSYRQHERESRAAARRARREKRRALARASCHGAG